MFFFCIFKEKEMNLFAFIEVEIKYIQLKNAACDITYFELCSYLQKMYVPTVPTVDCSAQLFSKRINYKSN